jgi:hypothetical protein
MNQQPLTPPPSSKNFSEEAFFSAYKQIRNQFRRYYPHTIIVEALNYLRSPTSGPVEDLQKHPWLVFLLLKWVLLDEQYSHRDKQRILTFPRFFVFQEVGFMLPVFPATVH